jgi:hypothetical protein
MIKFGYNGQVVKLPFVEVHSTAADWDYYN